MSIISKDIIPIEKGVVITLDNKDIIINGPLGKIKYEINTRIMVSINNNKINLSPENKYKDIVILKTTKTIIKNFIYGVVNGFEKKLILTGVGYKAQIDENGKNLNLSLGFSHQIIYKIPYGINIKVLTQNEIIIKGVDKQKVGQVAAEIRKYRIPEIYKGKGIRYFDEIIILKETKKK